MRKKEEQQQMSQFLNKQQSHQKEKIRQQNNLLNHKEFGLNKQLLKDVEGLNELTQNIE